MISLMPILLLLVAACIVWVLIDFVVAGSGLSKELRRWLRARHGDSIEIDMPSVSLPHIRRVDAVTLPQEEQGAESGPEDVAGEAGERGGDGGFRRHSGEVFHQDFK